MNECVSVYFLGALVPVDRARVSKGASKREEGGAGFEYEMIFL